jgi:N-acyl-L-homoserine lactone synthetase
VPDNQNNSATSIAMDADDIGGEISLAAGQFTVEQAISPEQVREVSRLRRQVFCLERGFEAGVGEEEPGEFDAHSRHVLLRQASDGAVVGTVRILAPNLANLENSFPMQRICDASWLRSLPLRTTGEISRFAISKERRMSYGPTSLLCLILLQGVVQLSSELGLTHWIAVMEPSLIRLNQRNGIHFQPAGPLVSYHGIRQPAIATIAAVLDRMRREHWKIWDYLTNSGVWLSAPSSNSMATIDGNVFDDERAIRIGSRWLAGERVAGTPARHVGDVALKLRMLAFESKSTTSAFAARLLQSALADLDRLAAS